MSSKRQQRSFRKSFLIIVDGETEKWYIDLLKKHERGRLPNIKIKPELPKKKKLKVLYEKIVEESKDYDKVIWIVDLDAIKHDGQMEKFKLYVKTLQKNENVKVLVNNPCLEFWFLLHFTDTGKVFSNCKSVENELKKITVLKNYQKTETYFKSSNDIYKKLKPYKDAAITNAKNLGELTFENIKSARAEMYLLFDMLFENN